MGPIGASVGLMGAGTSVAGAGMAPAAGMGLGAMLGPIGLIGMGLMGSGLFNKKKSQKSYYPVLSQASKGTEAILRDSAMKGYYGTLTPPNLISSVLSPMMKQEAARAGAAGAASTGISASETPSGAGLKFITGEGVNRMRGAFMPEAKKAELRNTEFMNSLNALSGLRDIDLKAQPSKMMGGMVNSQINAMESANRGASYGNLATLAAMMAF